MSIESIVEGWLQDKKMCCLNPEDISLVFHTSCVNFQEDDLYYLEKKGMRWCVPDNVRIELELLRENGREYGESAYSRRAGQILRNARKDGGLGRTVDGDLWDLEQLYIAKGRKGTVDRDMISCDTMLFLFGDRYKMYEFLEHGLDLHGHFILVFREEEWSCAQGRVASLSQEHGALRQAAKEFWSGRECRPVDIKARTQTKNELRRIRIQDDLGVDRIRGLGMAGAQLTEQKGSGSYATVYQAPSALGECTVKLFTDWSLVGSGVGKIRQLAAASGDVQHLPLAMPRLLLKWSADNTENREVIGYTMKSLAGQPASRIALSQWPDGMDPRRMLRRIGALLVEVHCRGMLVNDLSYHNVLVSDDGRVGFVDCDSFQIRGYPGGQITPIYRHPDVNENDCERCLRKPIHEYFAFTVLMYQLIMGVIDPLNALIEELGQKRDWKNTTFPLDWDTRSGSSVGSEILSRWIRQDEPTRRLFADVLHFRSSPSIGAILRELGLL